MSVFEELIDELKEENLLEETVFSTNRSAEAPAAAGSYNALELDESDGDDELLEKADDARERSRRRAMDEVSSLQMVEHVLSGIEREHMKMSPQTFDDLDVKKALHKYLQGSSDINSDGHSNAGSALYRETEKWFSSLAQRDANISVANVRRFCENSRPILSSQALMALARFYRNSPFTEAVRGKFDFVMTRLFSREVEDQKRRLLFGRLEMLEHVKVLYANWSSLSLTDGAADSIVPSVTGFEEFVRETEAADSFDDLINSDFFNRVRLFKEGTVEGFFEPGVVAAAMECNVRIGNRFVDLIQKERSVVGEDSIEEKYGYAHDTIISGAASKTLLLLDLLRDARDADVVVGQQSNEVRPAAKVIKFERAPVQDSRGVFGINKWLIAATVLILALSAGVYFWSEKAVATQTGIEIAPPIDIAGTELQQHVREASTSTETLYGVMQPTWDALTEEEQKQFLTKAFDFAKSRGMRKVNLLNGRGRTVGYASAERLEVFGPQ